MSVLHIQEAPESRHSQLMKVLGSKDEHPHGHNRIHNGEAPIEGKLCYLRSLELPESISKFNHRLVFFCGVAPGSDAIVSRLFDWVVHGLGIFQVYRLCQDWIR